MELTDNQFIGRRQVLAEIAKAAAKEDVERAAGLLASCQEDLGEELLHQFENNPALPVLAAIFARAKDFRRAAQAYESCGMLSEAARFYEEAQNYAKAAPLYLKTGNPEAAGVALEKANRFLEAAEIFVKLKDPERAAIDYAQGGEYFNAGRYFLQAKKIKRALNQLQKIKPADGHFVEAVLLMGKILQESKHTSLAEQKFLMVLRHRGDDPRLLPIHYELAALYRREGAAAKERRVLKQIVKVNANYQDAAARLKKLEAAPEEPEQKEETFTPQPAEKDPEIISIMEGFEFLKDTPLFEPLSLEETKLIFEICEQKTVQKGDIIIEQGIPGWGLFIIKSGSLQVQLEEGGQLKDLLQLGPGNYVGEMSLIDQATTSAKVIAAEKSELIAINRVRFNDLLNAHLNIHLKVLNTFVRILSERLRKTTADLARLK